MLQAIQEANTNGMVQPGLLVLGKEQFFVKVESEAICVPVGCVAEAVGSLFASFFVFNCHYPPPLHLVYGLFEELFDLPRAKRSVKAAISISNFLTKISTASTR